MPNILPIRHPKYSCCRRKIERKNSSAQRFNLLFNFNQDTIEARKIFKQRKFITTFCFPCKICPILCCFRQKNFYLSYGYFFLFSVDFFRMYKRAKYEICFISEAVGIDITREGAYFSFLPKR